jgi:2-polyprenyl-6-hydroxyphenyl methylase/3-demethylubiquinone-9 3-methyltransferase
MPAWRWELNTVTQNLGVRECTILSQGQPCKICGGFSPPFDSLDFFKFCSPTNPFAFGFAGIPVEYRRCRDCGFIFTDFFDDWSPEEFASYVYNSDYARIDSEYADIRPANIAAIMTNRLAGWRNIDILDYGSGSGAFADRMAERGFFNITNYDPFSSPARPERKFSLITCFEVMEHTTSPRACLVDMVSFLTPGGCIVFSQPLQPENIESIRGAWWYIGPRNGHASIFTADALSRLGSDCGLVLHRGDWLHGFAAAGASEVSCGILAAIGSPYAWLRLDAPTDSSFHAPQRAQQVDAWHALEWGGGVRYRWTRSGSLAWHGVLPDLVPLTVRISIPLVNEVTPGFAEDSRLEINGEVLIPRPHAEKRSALIFEAMLKNAPENEVILHTPAPMSPHDVRGVSDDRLLGLAIPVYPWEPPATTT